MQLENFSKKIEYVFTNQELLIQAITHPSVSKKKTNYERLEFLGDKVLGLVISEFLIKKYPQESEGDLSKRQAGLVSGQSLSKIASEIGLNEILIVSKGEENLGGKNNKNNLENALEALIGAIYLDSGLEKTKKFIHKFWQESLEKNIKPPKDPVSQLQEIIQSKTKKLPQYDIQKAGGLDHEPVFIAKLKIPDFNLDISAKGNSKKAAQKEVARKALNNINQK